MLKKSLLIVILLTAAGKFFAHNDSAKIVIPHVNPALRFTENAGQWDNKILFRAQLDGGLLFLEKGALTFNFYDKKKYRSLHHGGIMKGIYRDMNINCHAYKINFENANASPSIEKYEAGSDYENFFLGNDRNKWRSNVRNYHRVWYRNIYSGIDYEVITASTGIKYNFHIKAGNSVEQIRLRYEGLSEIKMKNGALIYKLSTGDVTEQKPYAYQIIGGKAVVVPCNYRLRDKVLSFEFPKGYNAQYDLVIDPTLVFAAQSGSTADNFGMTATFDPAGNLISGGTAFDIGYPTTPGAYSVVFNGPPAQGNTDVVITKYASNGATLLFSTYIGGSGAEIVTSLIVDHSNNLCFYGATGSSNFPMTPGAYDNSFNGGVPLSFVFNGTTFNNGTDIYIGKFNSTGTQLLASTYIGGSNNDGVNHVNQLNPLPPPFPPILEYLPDSLQHNYGDQYRGEIQVDVSNNIYIASSSRSSDFPTTPNASDNTIGGPQDAVVAKFNTSLTQLLYSTFLGGAYNDCGNSLIVNNNQEVYVTGGTCSPDFSVTPGAWATTFFGGIADGFLSHLSTTGGSLLQSTFVGSNGNNYDQSYIVQSDRNNNIYVYGQSLGNMPVVPSGTNALYTNPGTHQFITRFNSTLSNVNMSTVFGSNTNSIDISPSAFSVDKCDNIYISGWGGNIVPPYTQISNMPMASPTQSTTDGNDFYLMGLTGNATSILYGSYFGGAISDEHVDGGTSRFDPRGVIYQSVCARCGGNDDFPVTPGAWPNTPGNPNHAQNCNNGVFKINFDLLVTVSTIQTNTVSGCVPLPVSFTNATPGSSFMWYFGNGQTNSVTLNPSITYTAPGVYTVSLVVLTPTNCNVKDSSITFITVLPGPTSALSASLAQCTNTVTFTNNSSGTLSPNPFVWNLGDGSPTQTVNTPPPHTYTADGTYTITLQTTAANGCTAVAAQTVNIFNFTTAVNSVSMCVGDNASLTASGGTSYSWSPSTGLSNPNAASPAVTPTSSTVYSVQISNNSAGYTCSRTLTTSVTVYPKPTAIFASTMNPCGGGVNFFDSSVPNITAWQWTLSAVASSTLQNPYYFYSNGGTNTITLIVTTGDGCKDTMQQVITVPVPPAVSVNSGSTVCAGTPVQLSASGGTAYAWTPTVSLDVPTIANPSASPTVSTQYSVVISAGNNCSFLLTTNVSIVAPPPSTAYASANPTFVVTGNSTQLTYNGPPGLTVTWMPVGTTTPSAGYTVSASPNKPTTYTAVVSNGACGQRASVFVEAYTEGCIDKDVFVPNTFTPNGDGQNDILYVRGLKVEEVYFAVYNRWGEMVFETNDKNRGWDGVYKGRAADVGVFGWYLKVKCFNGEETFRKGNVTLIR